MNENKEAPMNDEEFVEMMNMPQMRQLAYIFNMPITQVVEEYEAWNAAINSNDEKIVEETELTFINHLSNIYEAVN